MRLSKAVQACPQPASQLAPPYLAVRAHRNQLRPNLARSPALLSSQMRAQAAVVALLDLRRLPASQAFESRSMRGLKRLAADPMFPATGHAVQKRASEPIKEPKVANGASNGAV